MSSVSEEEGSLCTGVVKWYDFHHGYGFIRSESRSKIFFHKSAIKTGNESNLPILDLSRHEEVEFVLSEGEKGPMATEITDPNGCPFKSYYYRRRKRGRRHRQSQHNGPTPQARSRSQSHLEDDNPYFCRRVSAFWLGNRVLKEEIIYPFEWVIYEEKKDVFSYAQVGYPILPSDFVSYESIASDISSLEYVIYLRDNDEVGKKVRIQELSKLNFSTENRDRSIQPRSKLVNLPSQNLISESILWPVDIKANAVAQGAIFSSSGAFSGLHITTKGERWVKQAEVDFGMLEINKSQAQENPTLKGFGLVCFLSHQVCEKALKGGVYANCRYKDERKTRIHKLTELLSMIRAAKDEDRKHIPPGTLKSIDDRITPSFEAYFFNTRYQDCWSDDKIPADHFTPLDANKAFDIAEFVLKKVKEEIMPPT